MGEYRKDGDGEGDGDGIGGDVTFEGLMSVDEMDWTSEDFGGLNMDEWELDEAEVKRLITEWRRNVLDPVMSAYLQRKLPWTPDMPEAIEIDDWHREEEEDEDEEEADAPHGSE